MEQPSSTRFVPFGVDAQSWMGFEQRIQERRFRALLETTRALIAAGDAASARLALDEARELRPHAPELGAFEARLATLPSAAPQHGIDINGSRILGASALLLLGISLVTALDYMRSTAAPSPAAVETAPAYVPSIQEEIVLPVPNAGPATDVAVAPQRAQRPLGTSGLDTPVSEDTPRELQTTKPIDPEPLPPGEVPDDFVYPAPTDVMPRSMRSMPLSPITQPTRTSTSALLTPQDQRRVSDVPTAYARAYARLDAGAARQVWPS